MLIGILNNVQGLKICSQIQKCMCFKKVWEIQKMIAFFQKMLSFSKKKTNLEKYLGF